MTNSNAPKPPAGWYPLENGQPGKRYWDGDEWTGKTKGVKQSVGPESKIRNGESKRSKKKIFVVAGASVALLLVAVAVVLGSGNSDVRVPDVEGLTESEAIHAVEAVGLVAETEMGISTTGKKAGIADSSTPGVNAKIKKGSTVTILISSGKGDDHNSFFEDSGSAPAPSWAPAGYTIYNDDVATQWVQNGPDPCGSVACTYSTLNVTSHFGCLSGLYVEVNFLDDAGTVYDWSNDTVPALGAGQVAQLQFQSFESSGGGKVQIANISCY